MKKHRLLLFEQISRRVRGKVFLLLVVALVAAIVDYYTEFLGDFWYLSWVVAALLFVLWFYYAVWFRRSGLQIRENTLRLRGPLGKMDISYGRIYSVTAGHMEQHYPIKTVRWGDRGMLRPLYGPSGVFIELSSVPKNYRWRHLWFPRYLFGTRHDGVLICGGDWMEISHDIEAARAQWHEKYGQRERRGQTSAQRLGLE